MPSGTETFPRDFFITLLAIYETGDYAWGSGALQVTLPSGEEMAI